MKRTPLKRTRMKRGRSKKARERAVRWREIVQQRIEMVGGKCEACGRKATLHGHHYRAKGMGGSTDADTLENSRAVCSDCHPHKIHCTDEYPHLTARRDT